MPGADRLPDRSRLSIGVVTTLDDPAFSRDRIADGMRSPVDAADPVGFGLYLLQPYDPSKTPVVFVHGIGATARDFRPAIEALDRAQFQPWVMSYPTGMRLSVVAQVLAEGLTELRDRYAVSQVIVTAHSMGGLVARAAVLQLSREGQSAFIEALITLSTPYGGEGAAALGAHKVPGMVPSWIDLAPGSDFLRSLETPLPKSVPFYLLFSYGNNDGDRHFWNLARWFGLASLAGSNDGAVTLSSQLAPYAQENATQMFGFDVDHASIVALPEALQRLGGLFAAIAEVTVPLAQRR